MTKPTPKARGTKKPSPQSLNPPATSQTASYQAAYERLSQIASELEDGQTDLDKVLPLLSEAQAAYAVCQERIDRLQALLNSVPTPAGPEAEDS